jgi:Clr5 domain
MYNRFKNCTPETYKARTPSQEWERHKAELQELNADGSTVVEIVALMKEKYGFPVQ